VWRKEDQVGSDRDVLFKYSQPNGAASRKPSTAMAEALQRLSEANEMQTLVAGARCQGRRVVVQVFHSAEGYPILIHLGAIPQEAA
jgi:hypothetical protein